MKRYTSICLVFFSIFMLFVGVAYAAAEYEGTVSPNAVMLIDANSGKVLLDKNANEQIRPASTTKIMTCIVALEHSKPDEKVEVVREVHKGSRIGLVEGEKVPMGELLTAMMMVSGNDAAVAVAEHVGGSVDGFVDMMNDKAKSLGMEDSHFVNPHGLDEDGHMVTVADMAKLARHAFQNADFMKIVDRESFTMSATNSSGERVNKNTNHLLRRDEDDYYKYANGMKTGLTPKAGGCLVASATKDDTDLICLIFGDESSGEKERWDLAPKLFKFGFDNYVTIDISEFVADMEPIQAQIENYAATDEAEGLLEFEKPVFDSPMRTLDKELVQNLRDGTDKVVPKETYNLPLVAPIEKGDPVGTITFQSAETGDTIGSANLIASRTVLEAGAEPGTEGVVNTMPPIEPQKIKTQQDNPYIWFWLIIPAGLIGFLVFRLMTVNRTKRRRFGKKRRPHYSYKIRK